MTALGQIAAQITAAEQRFGRTPGAVQLIAVSKTRRPDELLQLVRAGQRRFGENYLQEASEKQAVLAHEQLEWHYIGSIQSNKTAELAQRFAWIHTVDREKIARRLSAQRDPALGPLAVCIQVNISDEATKSGVTLAELPSLALTIAELPQLQLRGLMAMPAPCPDFELQRQPFRRLARALDDLRKRGLELDTLSMGMSDDFVAAIAEGATMVRIGSALFGPRPAKTG